MLSRTILAAFLAVMIVMILTPTAFGQAEAWDDPGGWPTTEEILAGGKGSPGTNDSFELNEKPGESIAATTDPCFGKYCISLFTKTRTAKTVGKGRLSVAVKYQYIDYDDKKGSDDRYHDLGSDQYIKNKAVLTLKYGWAEDHHLGLCMPYMWNNFDVSGTVNRSDGFGNIALFEKWNCVKESKYIPGVAVDLWYYFPSGNTKRKLGSSQYSWKVTAEVSKAWKDFSLHLNPGYIFTKDRSADAAQFNAAVILTPSKTFWPALEYNFEHNESKGFSHDIVPGVIWRFAPGWSFKAGAVINLDRSKTYKDDLGLVMKLFYCFPKK